MSAYVSVLADGSKGIFLTPSTVRELKAVSSERGAMSADHEAWRIAMRASSGSVDANTCGINWGVIDDTRPLFIGDGFVMAM